MIHVLTINIQYLVWFQRCPYFVPSFTTWSHGRIIFFEEHKFMKAWLTIQKIYVEEHCCHIQAWLIGFQFSIFGQYNLVNNSCWNILFFLFFFGNRNWLCVCVFCVRFWYDEDKTKCTWIYWVRNSIYKQFIPYNRWNLLVDI